MVEREKTCSVSEVEVIRTQPGDNPLSRFSHGSRVVPLIPMCFISAVNVSIVSV